MGFVPHLVQYQGSKRNLASKILKYIPSNSNTIIEPFSGTAAITLACSYNNKGTRYIVNDLNKPLSQLLKLVVENPEYVSTKYEEIWNGQLTEDSISHYYKVREQFNKNNDPVLFLYLLARCVKGSVRYNSEGKFNQSPDKRRHGTKPETMTKNIVSVSKLLKQKTTIKSCDYKDILQGANKGDLIYMDPPYQGVCGDKDSRYFAGINHDEFIEELKKLSQKNVSFIVSYDGKLGNKSYGKEIPSNTGVQHIYLDAGISSQSTLLGKQEKTIESLYISNDLVEIYNYNLCKREDDDELLKRVS